MEGGEHLHHSGVVPGRITATCSGPRMPPMPRHAPRGRVLQRLGVAAGELPGAGQRKVRAVTTSAPIAGSPAPSARARPRAASRAVGGRSYQPLRRHSARPVARRRLEPCRRWCRPARRDPARVHRRPRRRAAHRFVTRKTLGRHAASRTFSPATSAPRFPAFFIPGTPWPGSGRGTEA